MKKIICNVMDGKMLKYIFKINLYLKIKKHHFYDRLEVCIVYLNDKSRIKRHASDVYVD